PESAAAELESLPAVAPSEAAPSRRAEPELVAVPMDDLQEQVYGWMGFSPSLLLTEPPSGDNVIVRVVRPGQDAEAVLEEARQQMASSGTRRRRRGGRGNGNGPGTQAPTDDGPLTSEASPAPVEITPLPQLEPEPVVTVIVPSSIPAEVPVEVPAAAAAVEPEIEEPRRRRRRSSAPTG
ncbi:hypothetical protein SYNGFB01_11655, partial [Synechococcus sp. GFB01]